VLNPEFPPRETHQPARGQPKQQQKHAAVSAEERQEEAAYREVGAQQVLKEHHRRRPQCALPRSIAENDPGIAGIQPVVDPQPYPQRKVNQQCKALDQSPVGVGVETESPLQVEVKPGLVGRLEGQRCQQHVRHAEQDSQLAMMAAEHFSKKNTRSPARLVSALRANLKRHFNRGAYLSCWVYGV
jgi:hypothetical protein